MKIPALLYFGAFAAMLAVDYLFNFLPKAVFDAQEATHPQVVEFINGLDNPIDATTGTMEERRFSLGFITRVDVNAGFRIVHDPGLGKEIIARGPVTALDQLSVSNKRGQLKPDFSKPLRLAELVEIRVNLQAHGSNRMRVNCVQEERRTSLLPVFTTNGPLKFQFLEMVNLSSGRVEVDTRDLVLWKSKYVTNVTGKTKRLEVLYEDLSVPEVNLPELSAGKKIRTERSTVELVKWRKEAYKKNQQQTIDSLLEAVRILQSDAVVE
ncbi:MAG: hypothetical protein ACI94D_000716 [Neolewinella sp.]|jgi:hypothetical protein